MLYCFFIYKLAPMYRDGKPCPDVDNNIRNFQIVFRGIDVEVEKSYEFGFMNLTYANFNKCDKNSDPFKLSEALRDYDIHTEGLNESGILAIDKFNIDKPHRGKGIGTKLFYIVNTFFNTVDGVDEIVLSPYPYELNEKHILDKNAESKEAFYSKYYLKVKSGLEEFYSRFGYEMFYNDDFEEYDVMRLETLKLENKLTDPLKSIFKEVKDGQLIFMFSAKENLDDFAYYEKENLKVMFPQEFK